MNRASAYKKTQVMTNDRFGVLLMVYEGTAKELRKARMCLSSGMQSPAELAILKAQSALVELDRTLNFEADTELANSLHNLYLHMLLTLSDVLSNTDLAELDRIIGLVDQLHETWSEAALLHRQNKQGVV